MIDDIVKTDVILAGSSLGGWLVCWRLWNAPKKSKVCWGWLPHRFYRRFETYIFTPEQKEKLYGEGRLEFVNADFTYVFTKALFETGRQNMLLNRSLPIKCPVHLIQDKKMPALTRKSVEYRQMFGIVGSRCQIAERQQPSAGQRRRFG
ncbi:MAG: hypothetical protein ACLSE6_03715 [Alphaproteobacteria bacterium]